MNAKALAPVEAAAQPVLDVRAIQSSITLAMLYSPSTMPADVARAHRALNRDVDKLYGYRSADKDVARVEFLFTEFAGLPSSGKEAAMGPLSRPLVAITGWNWHRL
jgi:hypothetical protein